MGRIKINSVKKITFASLLSGDFSSICE